MGFLFRNHQSTKIRKNQVSAVGIADDNDLGSFSGLEVAIDTNKSPTEEDETKHFCNRNENQETAKETKKKRNEKLKSIRKVGFFFRSKEKRKGDSLAATRPNRDKNCDANSNESNDISVYTSNHMDGLAFTSIHNGATVQITRARGGLGSDGFVTVDHVSDLILDLDTAVIVGTKRTIRALKMLLALSSTVPVIPTTRQSSSSSSPPSCRTANNSKSIQTIRIEMARAENGRLIPVLLSFLNRCMAQSKEHTLTLLLLGNLSIPQENKKMIALDCKGAEILAKLLCEDPSSHLVALVLVNLTYDSFSESKTTSIEVTMAGSNSSNNNKIDVVDHDCDDRESSSADRSSLRKELLATNGDNALVESLAFALRVSTLTKDEYERRRDTIEDCNYSDEYQSPATKLSILMAKDQQLRSSEKEDDTPIDQRSQLHRQRVLPATASPEQIIRQLRSNEQELQHLGSIDGMIVEGSLRTERGGKVAYQREEARSHPNMVDRLRTTQVQMHPPPIVEKSKQIYPETAKWCLSALRNLTKPCNCDATAAHVLIKSGIFSLIVQCITTLGVDSSSSGGSSSSGKSSASTSTSAIDVTRMGISRMEELSSPPHPPLDIEDVTVNSNIQLDINFLSSSYGKMCSRNVTDQPHSTAGAVSNIGCGRGVVERESEREAPTPTMSSLLLPTSNSPYSWESNSMQDAALSVVLNLSASSRSREYMNEPHIVKILSTIAGYPKLLGRRLRKNVSQSNVTITSEEHQTMHFQALKARMALSYLIGSQGHFGQTKLRSSASTVLANRANSPLVMSNSDVELLVELLANTMHHRGKEGNSGGNYLSGTFDLKCVIFSLRFLLTHTSNQERIAKLLGMELNSLLINAVGKYALEPSTGSIDWESAGHVVFSLYLMSNHGFEGLPFLPEMYGPQKKRDRHRHRHDSVTASTADKDHGLAANILVSYLRLSNIPPEGRHAARQLLLRFENLNFENKSCTAASDMTTRRRIMQKLIRSEDLKIDYILLAKIKRVRIANRKHGSKPNPAIFNRPVLRCQKPCNWDEENNRLLSSGRKQNQIKPKRKIDWSNRSTVSTFANALIAVQQLSYGSIKIRHSLSGSIDDVAIANEIARCCTSNEIQGGCYNFLWTWEDDAKPPKKSCGECKRGSTSLSLNTKGRHQLRNTGTRCCEDKNIELSTPYGLGSIASGNRSIAVEAESSTNSNEKFSLLRLCCSSDSTDSSISEIEISSQVEV